MHQSKSLRGGLGSLHGPGQTSANGSARLGSEVSPPMGLVNMKKMGKDFFGGKMLRMLMQAPSASSSKRFRIA